MKSYDRDGYTINEYDKEKYMLEILCDEENLGELIPYKTWEEAYMDAKKEIKKGNKCKVWELKYEFI